MKRKISEKKRLEMLGILDEEIKQIDTDMEHYTHMIKYYKDLNRKKLSRKHKLMILKKEYNNESTT